MGEKLADKRPSWEKINEENTDQGQLVGEKTGGEKTVREITGHCFVNSSFRGL